MYIHHGAKTIQLHKPTKTWKKYNKITWITLAVGSESTALQEIIQGRPP